MIKKITIFASFFLSLLIIIEIWVSHSLINYGEKLQKIEDVKKSLTLENQIIENEIAEESSLAKIASRSGSLGFSNPKDIQYIR